MAKGHPASTVASRQAARELAARRRDQSGVERAEALRLYQSGYSIEAAAHAVGRSPCFLQEWMSKQGIPRRAQGNPQKVRPARAMPKAILSKAVARYVAGESATLVAMDSRLSRVTLMRELKRLDVAIRIQALGDPAEIIAAYSTGLSCKAVGYKSGCDKRRGANVLREAGIPQRKRRVGACPQNARRLGRERSAIIKAATPKWVDRQAILAVYRQAVLLTEESGVLHEVDHIIPLKSKRVCGLHVPWNLRPLPQAENRRKRNRLLPELAIAS